MSRFFLSTSSRPILRLESHRDVLGQKSFFLNPDIKGEGQKIDPRSGPYVVLLPLCFFKASISSGFKHTYPTASHQCYWLALARVVTLQRIELDL